MKKLGARVLLASVLAIGAQLAGCGDVTDCPGAVADHTSCSTAGLTCFAGAEQCTCTAGSWQCKRPDMAVPDMAHDMRGPIDD
jgi:hypothetical protein